MSEKKESGQKFSVSDFIIISGFAIFMGALWSVSPIGFLFVLGLVLMLAGLMA